MDGLIVRLVKIHMPWVVPDTPVISCAVVVIVYLRFGCQLTHSS